MPEKNDRAAHPAAPAPVDATPQYPAVFSRDAAIAQALAETGQMPSTIEHIGPTEPSHGVALRSAAPPTNVAPRAIWGQSSTYLLPERDIFASSVGRRVTSYTFDAASVAADSDGNKIVMEGTVCAMSSAKLQPRVSSYTAVGVLSRRINLRNGDQDVGLVVSGALRIDKLWDDGNFGVVAAQAQLDLATTGIVFFAYDV